MTASAPGAPPVPAPVLPDLQDPVRHFEWRDTNGIIVASTAVDAQGTCLMRVDGVAAFSWSIEGGDVSTRPASRTVPLAEVHDVYRRCVLPFVVHSRGTQVLHASAALGDDGVVVLCARSGTGKSTLAYALHELAGYSLWADDAVAFTTRGDVVTAEPLPFALRLRPSAQAHFGHAGAAAVAVGSDASAPVASVVVLEQLAPTSHEPTAATSLRNTEAFTRVFEHAFCLPFSPESVRAATETYLDLVARVPVRLVRFPGRLDEIPAVVDEIVRPIA